MHRQNNSGRRDFIKKASVAGILSVVVPQIVSQAFAADNLKKIVLKKEDVVLFQGDSITDAGRKRTDATANSTSALGAGYAFIAASEMLYRHADKNLKIYNKGISGDKVPELIKRWPADCTDLAPNVLSILVGVNDFWAITKHGYTGTVEQFKTGYSELLASTKQRFPDLKIILGEPFAVKGVKEVDEKWYPAFDRYRQVVRELAHDFGTSFIAYQSVFDKAQQQAPGSYWTIDGVHPTLAGAQLMAQAWLQAVKM